MEHPDPLIARYFPHGAPLPDNLQYLLQLELGIRHRLLWDLANIEEKRKKLKHIKHHPAHMVPQHPYDGLRQAELEYSLTAADLTNIKTEIQKECEKLDAPPRLSSSMTLRAARGPRMMQPP